MKMQDNESGGLPENPRGVKRSKIRSLLFECVLALLVIILLVFLIFPKDSHTGQVASPRTASGNNLYQIGMAMSDFINTHGAFPPAVYCDKHGTPLYSWRVLLLPYLEEQTLFMEFKSEEPWDSPSNKPLLARMPSVYRHPLGDSKEPYTTYYQVFTGGGAIFDPRQQPILRFADIIDGCSKTFTVVEAGTAVPWTKPEDLPYSPDQPLPKLGGVFPDGLNALTADGRVHWVPKNVNEKTIRAMITYKGGESECLPD